MAATTVRRFVDRLIFSLGFDAVRFTARCTVANEVSDEYWAHETTTRVQAAWASSCPGAAASKSRPGTIDNDPEPVRQSHAAHHERHRITNRSSLRASPDQSQPPSSVARRSDAPREPPSPIGSNVALYETDDNVQNQPKTRPTRSRRSDPQRGIGLTPQSQSRADPVTAADA